MSSSSGPEATLHASTLPALLETDADLARFLDSLDVSAMKLGLERIRRLLAHLENPQDQLPMVHIAGTNGKGSVTAMLSSVFRAAGLRTGAYISPHLVDIRERITLNGQPIVPKDFRSLVNEMRLRLTALGWERDEWPTYFEFLNAVAYAYFLKERADITVFETGLGGRLDSTNVVLRPNLTVITTIGLDHMRHLGDTLAEIAAEKAGILKAGTPVVLGSGIPAEARRVILERARRLDVPVIEADAGRLSVSSQSAPETGLVVQDIDGRTHRLSLPGAYQTENLAVVLACVEALRRQGFPISDAQLAEGLASTVWPARFQYIASQRLLIDGSHNEDGFRTFEESLARYFPTGPKAWLLSLRANRDPKTLLSLPQRFGQPLGVVVTWAEPTHLYHPPERLAELLRASLGDACPVFVAPDPISAFQRLRDCMSNGEQAMHEPDNIECKPLGIVTGSLYTAGAALTCLEQVLDVTQPTVAGRS